MNHRNDDYKDITQLFDTALDRDLPPEAERQFQQHFSELKARCAETKKSTSPSWRFSWRLAWSGSAVFVAAFVIIIAVTIFRLPGFHAYAAAMQALQSVHSIHLTGWTENLHSMIGAYSKEWEAKNEPIQFEIWEWRNAKRKYRNYKKGGPFTVVDDSEQQYEYNQETGELYIKKSGDSYLEDIPAIPSKLLESLYRLTITQTDLGERTIDGRLCTGLRLERKTRRKEYWFDKETNLPVEIAFYKPAEGEWQKFTHARFAYNQPIPQKIMIYTGPANPKSTHYDWDIDPELEPWRQNLRQLAARYQDHPLPETMELVQRQTQDDIIRAIINGKMPGIDGYSVYPLPRTLGDYFRPWWRGPGTFRTSQDLRDIQLNHDLVLVQGIGRDQQTDFILDLFGLEIIYTQQERTVWVARYDGRKLKPWKDVKAPVSKDGARALHPGMCSSTGPNTMDFLLSNFNYWQDYDLTANAIFIVNETGLTEPHANLFDREEYAVSNENPYWGGEKSIELARRWFADEFGVTFTEEKRVIPLFIMQKK